MERDDQKDASDGRDERMLPRRDNEKFELAESRPPHFRNVAAGAWPDSFADFLHQEQVLLFLKNSPAGRRIRHPAIFEDDRSTYARPRRALRDGPHQNSVARGYRPVPSARLEYVI